MAQEIHSIPGITGYGASKDGRIWSKRRGDWKELSLSSNGKCGYMKVNVGIIRKTYKVHVLIAMTFIGERPKGMDVNHIDGNKTNNNIDNLEYISRKDNVIHAHKTGLYKSRYISSDKPKKKKIKKSKQVSEHKPRRMGEQVTGSKLNADQVKEIKRLHSEGRGPKELSSLFGVSAVQIWRITSWLKWKHII
jgi:hypothetical protein